MSLEELLKQYGLPLAGLVGFAWALFKGWLVTGRHLTAVQAESDGWEALYRQEREDRIAAQKTVGDFAPANAKVAEAVAALSEKVVSRMPRTSQELYEERLRGGD